MLRARSLLVHESRDHTYSDNSNHPEVSTAFLSPLINFSQVTYKYIAKPSFSQVILLALKFYKPAWWLFVQMLEFWVLITDVNHVNSPPMIKQLLLYLKSRYIYIYIYIYIYTKLYIYMCIYMCVCVYNWITVVYTKCALHYMANYKWYALMVRSLVLHLEDSLIQEAEVYGFSCKQERWSSCFPRRPPDSTG